MTELVKVENMAREGEVMSPDYNDTIQHCMKNMNKFIDEVLTKKWTERTVEGEVLSPDSAFSGKAIPGTYGAITRFPLREVRMMPDFEKESRGYQVHQVQCFHRRRHYYYRQWSCADCGEKL